jgi:predicted dehydrogenase
MVATVARDAWTDARLVAGPVRTDERRDLEEFARSGGTVLLVLAPNDPCGTELAGVEVIADHPVGEWFVTLADRPESARLPGEVAISSPIRTLRPVHPAAVVAATTSIGFVHHATIAVRPLGAGRVVVSGITDLDTLRAHASLGIFVGRLLAPMAAAHAATTLGVGVVGYGPFGGMGHLHGLAATETDGLRFVAAADAAPERLVAARADFPELIAHDTAEQLGADPHVDIAVIATPPVLHADLARELLRAGKHVVIEKPMCLHRRDADEIIALAEALDLTVTVHQSRRWDRDWLALRRTVDRGDIGTVFNIETFVGGFEHPCRAWHSEESVSGCAIYDWGSHHVDWINLLYGGAPARVLCTTHARRWHDTTNVDHLSLWMQWDDGREASFRQSDVAAIRRPKFYVQGTDGTIEGHYRTVRTESVEPGRGYVEHHHHHAEAPVSLVVVRDEPGFGLVRSELAPAPHAGWAFHRNLADHLLLGEPLAVAPGESRDVVRVLEAATLSGSRGGVVVEL